MKMTILYYRVDGRNPCVITERCPKTHQEVEKIKKLNEKEKWMRFAGIVDEDMRGFRLNRSVAEKKLLSSEEVRK